MQSIALERGGWCLSPDYINCDSKLWWQCGEGHIWDTTAGMIKHSGHWCPECASRRYRSENACRKFFEAIFSKNFPQSRPNWLRGKTGKKLELDGYCKELKLAFEYQGEQHYKFVNYLKGKNIEKIQKHDRLKTELCKKNNVTLIQIPYYISYEKMQDFIIKECKNNSVELPKDTPFIDYKKFDIYSLKLLEEMQQMAITRGGKCKSDVYVSALHKIEFECAAGHEFTMKPNDIKTGHWCPKCGGTAKLTIEDMKKIAEERGGKCLSSKYIDNKHELLWQCDKGHIWKARPDKITVGHWCHTCHGRNISIVDMQNVALERGGWCLSPKYLGALTRLWWQCGKDHVWDATPNMVKNDNTWCPVCANRIRGPRKFDKNYKQFPHKLTF